MATKVLKPAAIFAALLVLVGYFLFGGSFLSYVRTSGRMVQQAAKDQVSVEFELQRARDLVDEILPQLQANVRLIAEEEVEIAALEKEITVTRKKLVDQREQLTQLRRRMEVEPVSRSATDARGSRHFVSEQLATRFTQYRHSEMILDSKERLLESRQRALRNSLASYDRTKLKKQQLQQQIEVLAAKHRAVQSSSVGADVSIDDSQLGRVEELLGQIRRRLDISERVLLHEAELDPIQSDNPPVDQAALLSEFDEYFSAADDGPRVARK